MVAVTSPPPPMQQCWPAAPGLKHPTPCVSSREWAVGSGHGYNLGAFKDTKRRRCPKRMWGHWHGQNEQTRVMFQN